MMRRAKGKRASLGCIVIPLFIGVAQVYANPSSHSVALKPGWNLISVPIQPIDPTITVVLSNVADNARVVYAYDGLSYLSYLPGASDNTLSTIDLGRGYWIYMDGAIDLVVQGSLASKDVPLKAGWNLVGYNSPTAMPVSRALISVDGKYHAVYAFDTLGNRYQSFAPEEGMDDLTRIEPGRGYWIYAKEHAVWRVPVDPPQIPPEAVQIQKEMQRVAEWQLVNPSRHPTDDWTQATFYAGLIALAQISNEDRYWRALKGFAAKNNWRLGRKRYYADHQLVGWLYQEMFSRERDPKMIKPTQEVLDYILANPSRQSLKMPDSLEARRNVERWNWSDALFMAPPVWARMSVLTGDSRYLDFMNREWWAVTNHLYDKTEHLYYRDDRFFSERAKNGKKVFWSRGNGWVLAGLARSLEVMPKSFPDRPKYVNLFREMASKVSSLQSSDGMWRPSLLDPGSFPVQESSGTALFCYGLTWGINEGLLDKSLYLPAVKKAWNGLLGCVDRSGKLGYVQPIGADPSRVDAGDTEVYGVGVFLLAGSEMHRLARTGNY